MRRKLGDLIDKGETWEINMLDVSVFEKHWEIFSVERKRGREKDLRIQDIDSKRCYPIKSLLKEV